MCDLVFVAVRGDDPSACPEYRDVFFLCLSFECNFIAFLLDTLRSERSLQTPHSYQKFHFVDLFFSFILYSYFFPENALARLLCIILLLLCIIILSSSV